MSPEGNYFHSLESKNLNLQCLCLLDTYKKRNRKIKVHSQHKWFRFSISNSTLLFYLEIKGIKRITTWVLNQIGPLSILFDYFLRWYQDSYWTYLQFCFLAWGFTGYNHVTYNHHLKDSWVMRYLKILILVYIHNKHKESLFALNCSHITLNIKYTYCSKTYRKKDKTSHTPILNKHYMH